MPKKNFTEEQITYALRQAEGGMSVADVCRKLGVTEQTFLSFLFTAGSESSPEWESPNWALQIYAASRLIFQAT